MADWPPMAACLLTYDRTDYAVRTAVSFCTNFKYPNLAWYIADDGSSDAHGLAITSALEMCGATIFGGHAEKMGPGPSWNRAIENSLHRAEIILWVEDDWELQDEIDVTKYVKLLMEKPEVGMIRLGYMAVGLNLHSVGHDGTHYLRVEKSTPYAYSGNPSIRHRRYFTAYDWYPESPGVNPGECELWHDDKVRKTEGPEIWWPMDLKNGGWGGGFGHIGEKQSY